MKQVNIAEFKAHLSEHLREVRKGEDLVVLDRRVPVARVLPYRDASSFELHVRQPTKDPALVSRLRFPPLRGSKRSDAVRALLADRRSR